MVRSESTSLLVRGTVAVILGIFAIAWPSITIATLVALFAIYVFCDAIGQFYRAYASDRGGSVAGHVLLGLLDIAAGIVALAWPSITVFVLAIWVAAWAVVTGVIEIGSAVASERPGGLRLSLGLLGVASILFGIVVFTHPYAGALSLALLFGLFLLVYGVNLLVTGGTLRREAMAGGRPAAGTAGWTGLGRHAEAPRGADRPTSSPR
ncbi:MULTISPECIES: HdeD family acid-resistance protein [unclassified Pseudofrankia]|uniref:HdeD family acid-resistance protein n=1 Tax=unclassified Pseudofrankia TaxID=2994372 RepID=UPI0008D9F3AD|nr:MULTISPECIES: DUF308 domain-containing protein [unclassified Pseudofrankia]MDT3443994.1 DUF308 domain-containing protein [Pseudofrankia sp. BMG5.37]OHV44394.1 hypothetical protein BCD48_02315 [Pseudofrankia sp. BMG5.36]